MNIISELAAEISKQCMIGRVRTGDEKRGWRGKGESSNTHIFYQHVQGPVRQSGGVVQRSDVLPTSRA